MNKINASARACEMTKAEKPRLECVWVKKNGHLEAYWFTAGDPMITMYAAVMAAA